MATSRIVVCDLHFNETDILIQGDRRVLVKNALPIISYNPDTEEVVPEISECIENVSMIFSHLYIDEEIIE